MKNNKQVTRKQHFVPQFYLKEFSNKSNFVEILDLENKRISKPRTYSSICYEDYFYGMETGKLDEVGQEIEEYLQSLETAIAPKYNTFIEKIIENKQITDDDLYPIAFFMSMLWIRSKHFREYLNRNNNMALKKINKRRASHSNFKEDMKETLNDKNEKNFNDNDIDEYKNFLLDGKYDLKFNNQQHLLFFKEIGSFANLFHAKNWRAYIAPQNYTFITSDTPLSEWSPKRTGFWGNTFLDRKHYLTLTPKIMIELVNPISGKKFKRKMTEKSEVFRFNLLKADLSLDYCYCKNKKELDDMIKAINLSNPINQLFNKF